MAHQPAGGRRPGGTSPDHREQRPAPGRGRRAGDTPWRYQAVQPFTVTTDSSMTEDLIYTSDVLVHPGGDLGNPVSTLASYRDAGGSAAALVVDFGHGLTSVTRDLTTESGWSVTSLQTRDPVREVVAAVDALYRQTHVFYVTDGYLGHKTAGPGGFADLADVAACNGIGLTRVPLTGELVAYGLTSTGELQMVRRNSEGMWQALTCSVGRALDPGTTLLQVTAHDSGTGQDDWKLAVKDPAHGGLTIYSGRGTTLIGDPVHVTMPSAVGRILAAYQRANQTMFLVTDLAGNLYTVGFDATVTAVPNSSVVAGQIVPGTGASGLMRFYGLDSEGRISVLHQQSWLSNGPAWAPYIPFGAGVFQLAVPADPRLAATFFAAGADHGLLCFSQDPVTGAWTPARAQRAASAEPYPLAQYRTEVTVLDGNGNPAPNVQVTVTADTACMLSVAGVTHPVSTQLLASLSTNMLGKITIATPAFSLKAPKLTLSMAGLATPVPVVADAQLHDYLSGAGPLNGNPPLTADTLSATLQTQKINNVPLARAAVGNKALADAAAQGIMHAAAGATSTGVAASLRAQGIVGWALDLQDPANPSFQTFKSLDELQAHREQVHGEALLGGAWDDMRQFAGDVWEGIKRAAITVVHWTVNLVNNTVDQLAMIGKELQSLANMAIDGIEKAVTVIHSILNRIGALIDQAIEWLKALFAWGDIWDTKTALSGYLTQAGPYLQTLISERAEPLVQGWFAARKQDIESTFDGLKLPAGQSFKGLVDSTSQAVAGPLYPTARALAARPLLVGGAGAVNVSDLMNNNRHNWLLDKVMAYFGDGPALNTAAVMAAPLAQLGADYDKAQAKLDDALKNFTIAMKNLVTDPKTFSTLPVQGFLTAVKQLLLHALDFADAVIESALQVVSAALQCYGDLMAYSIKDLPLIGSLISAIAPGPVADLTIADLFCLLAAVPLTLAWKLAHGVDAKLFPGGQLPSRPVALGTPEDDPDEDAKTAVRFCGVGLLAILALFDTCLDAVPDAELLAFKIIDVVFPALAQVFTWPSGIPFTDVPAPGPADRANLANWTVAWVPVLANIALLVAPSLPFKGGMKANVARYIDPVGKVALAGLGGASLVTGIAASAETPDDPGAIALNILAPLPLATQVLRLDSVLHASEEMTGILKLVVDFFAGEGAAVALAAAK